ncbi:eukaryotic translation initiation factor 2-alpha kinase 1-like isoform X2 [Odontomachus brunneus]|uniref:eukaryotic translation initiation factor 2-alpha kinase 1-like isoform X2 n=1 Tax=Odontomachus brunneus TaxID=486640 RepID=UPI0013F266F1|nr:eukaryotic translation initiation factor 2-alpha kinase 1-like isoform X2 [Odontomachus brunneus]
MANIQDEGSTDQGMTQEDANETDHPWSTLETITTFDRGNDVTPTLCLDNIRESQDNKQVVQVTPPNSMLIISLIQQLCTMIEEDTVRRNQLYYALCDKMHELQLIDHSYNMMELESLRGQYQRALHHLFMIARASTGNENILRTPSYLTSEFSRYLREFQEIEFIASGGFGQVFKALHRLDGIEYAIKKIVVLSSRLKTITHYLEEVKTLAKLDHPNIVRYKVAWIEPSLPSSFVSSMPSTEQRSYISEYMKDSKSEKLQSDETSSNNNTSKSNFNKAKDSSRQDILFDDEASYTSTKLSSEQKNKVSDSASRHDTIIGRFHELNSLTNMGKRITEKSITQECADENSYIVSFRNSKNSETEGQAKYSNATYSSDSHEESSNHREVCTYFSTSNGNQQYMTLYIQMALYEQTLKQWMDERTNVTPLPVVRTVLKQIVCGLDYIHSQGIIHHDIKPSNIFIMTTGSLQIHLGDFGLACSLHKKNHDSVIGTQMYAAPEQLQGKCDTKSDIYSTGIILTELLILTQTQMELISIINSLKQGDIPEDLSTERHKWAQLIMQLIKEDPVKRPSAKQLLQDLHEEKDITITDLKNNLLDKDNTIQELQKEMALLKEKVRKLEISSKSTVQ